MQSLPDITSKQNHSLAIHHSPMNVDLTYIIGYNIYLCIKVKILVNIVAFYDQVGWGSIHAILIRVICQVNKNVLTDNVLKLPA